MSLTLSAFVCLFGGRSESWSILEYIVSTTDRSQTYRQYTFYGMCCCHLVYDNCVKGG